MVHVPATRWEMDWDDDGYAADDIDLSDYVQDFDCSRGSDSILGFRSQPGSIVFANDSGQFDPRDTRRAFSAGRLRAEHPIRLFQDDVLIWSGTAVPPQEELIDSHLMSVRWTLQQSLHSVLSRNVTIVLDAPTVADIAAALPAGVVLHHSDADGVEFGAVTWIDRPLRDFLHDLAVYCGGFIVEAGGELTLCTFEARARQAVALHLDNDFRLSESAVFESTVRHILNSARLAWRAYVPALDDDGSPAAVEVGRREYRLAGGELRSVTFRRRHSDAQRVLRWLDPLIEPVSGTAAVVTPAGDDAIPLPTQTEYACRLQAGPDPAVVEAVFLAHVGHQVVSDVVTLRDLGSVAVRGERHLDPPLWFPPELAGAQRRLRPVLEMLGDELLVARVPLTVQDTADASAEIDLLAVPGANVLVDAVRRDGTPVTLPLLVTGVRYRPARAHAWIDRTLLGFENAWTASRFLQRVTASDVSSSSARLGIDLLDADPSKTVHARWRQATTPPVAWTGLPAQPVDRETITHVLTGLSPGTRYEAQVSLSDSYPAAGTLGVDWRTDPKLVAPPVTLQGLDSRQHPHGVAFHPRHGWMVAISPPTSRGAETTELPAVKFYGWDGAETAQVTLARTGRREDRGTVIGLALDGDDLWVAYNHSNPNFRRTATRHAVPSVVAGGAEWPVAERVDVGRAGEFGGSSAGANLGSLYLDAGGRPRISVWSGSENSPALGLVVAAFRAGRYGVQIEGVDDPLLGGLRFLVLDAANARPSGLVVLGADQIMVLDRDDRKIYAYSYTPAPPGLALNPAGAVAPTRLLDFTLGRRTPSWWESDTLTDPAVRTVETADFEFAVGWLPGVRGASVTAAVSDVTGGQARIVDQTERGCTVQVSAVGVQFTLSLSLVAGLGGPAVYRRTLRHAHRFAPPFPDIGEPKLTGLAGDGFAVHWPRWPAPSLPWLFHPDDRHYQAQTATQDAGRTFTITPAAAAGRTVQWQDPPADSGITRAGNVFTVAAATPQRTRYRATAATTVTRADLVDDDGTLRGVARQTVTLHASGDSDAEARESVLAALARHIDGMRLLPGEIVDAGAAAVTVETVRAAAWRSATLTLTVADGPRSNRYRITVRY